jgi:hypothetical protein
MHKLLDGFKRKRDLGFFFSRYNPELDRTKLRQRFPKTYARFGKAFLSSFPTRFYKGKKGTFVVDLERGNFEAPMQVSLVTNTHIRIGKKYGRVKVEAFTVKLDFYKDTVKITGIQGGENASGPIREFQELAGMPIPNFLIQQIEEHARAQGYKKVQILRPEQSVHINSLPGFQTDRIIARTARGRELLDKWTRSRKYYKGKRIRGLTKSEHAELDELRKKAFKKVITARKKLYVDTANALGYAPMKNWFEKSLV